MLITKKTLSLFSYVLLFSFVVFVVNVNWIKTQPILPPPPIPHSFDFFNFVVQWPVTFCKFSTCQQIPNNFTIHGLWPENLSGILRAPRTPRNKPKPPTTFDSTLVTADLMTEISVHWPNLKDSSNSFIEAQWDNHGVFARPSYDQTKYLWKAIELKHRVHMFKILADEEIHPKNGVPVPVTEIDAAVYKVFGTFPIIKCYEDRSTKPSTFYLSEIILCFDADGVKQINCGKYHYCKPTTVIYPFSK